MENVTTSNTSFLGKILVLVLILGIGYAGQRIYLKNTKKNTIKDKTIATKDLEIKASFTGNIK